MTEISESGRFWINPSKIKPRSNRGGLNLLSMRNMNGLKNVDKMLGATSGITLNEAKLPNKA